MTFPKYTLTLLFMTLVIGTGLSLHRVSVAYGSGNMDGMDGGMDATGGTGDGMDNNNGNGNDNNGNGNDNNGNDNPTDTNTGSLGPSGTEENPTDTTTEFPPDALCDPAMSVTRDLVTTNCPEDNASSGGTASPEEDCNPDTPETNDITCPEICDNGIDDNNDGLTDAEDPDCAANGAPTAEASGPATVNEGDSVTLSGAESKDPDDDEITYSWTQTGGPSVSLDDPESSSPSFTAVSSQGAPCVDGKPTSTLTFSLVVSDGQEDSSPASVTVKVIHKYQPLSVTLGGQAIAKANEHIFIIAKASGGSGCGQVTYEWTQTGGSAGTLSSPDAQNPGFTTGSPNVPEDATLNVVVKEGGGESSATAQTAVKVCPFRTSVTVARHPPVFPDISSGDCDYSHIDVRANTAGPPLLGGGGVFMSAHLFIVIADKNGNEDYYRGGPSKSPFLGGGPIWVDWGKYEEGTIDWDPYSESKTVLSGADVEGKDACFAREASRINGAMIDYELIGPNSNTVVRTLLEKCNVPVDKPAGSFPGWNSPLI